MKVCTDACLFGAFAAHEIQNKNLASILDIGTGTGLLSLMLAQKNNTTIDAVEIDDSAFQQAKENIASSPWASKINVHHSNIGKFTSENKYDFNISNPPFFEDDLPSADDKKNAAKHDTTLNLPALLDHVNRLLSNNGHFAILLPYHRVAYFEAEAFKLNFHLSRSVLVKQTTAHQFFRGMLIFSRHHASIHCSELAVKNEAGIYSDEFIPLLKDYYLYLQ
jgi:tRNA1Val (adenine37-N6)-methyltransferase